MKANEVITTINSIPAGRFFRIKYTSDCPVKAEHKKKGVKVTKVTETTVRTGVAYEKIASVIEYKSTHEPKLTSPRANNWEWVTKNRIKYNTNTTKTYVVVAPIKNGGNTKYHYIITDENGERIVEAKDFDRNLLIDSYWSKSGSPDAIRTISVENVVAINA